MEHHPELTNGQRRLLDAYRRWGPTAIIVAISLASVLLAVGASTVVLIIQRAKPLDWFVALGESVVIPLIVAPLASGVTVRLAGVLVAAHDRMESMASTDPLTGLANRRRFFTMAARILAERVDGEVVLVAVTDIDAFKQVNDTHGHAVGDGALQLVGRQLAASVGGHGLSARFGGDEFACILRVPSERAGEMRDALSRACQEVVVGPGILLSASVGFGEVADHHDVDAALSRADDALYLAKAARARGIVQAA